MILDEFFFGNDKNGIHEYTLKNTTMENVTTRAVLESTGNMWMRIMTRWKRMK